MDWHPTLTSRTATNCLTLSDGPTYSASLTRMLDEESSPSPPRLPRHLQSSMGGGVVFFMSSRSMRLAWPVYAFLGNVMGNWLLHSPYQKSEHLES